MKKSRSKYIGRIFKISGRGRKNNYHPPCIFKVINFKIDKTMVIERIYSFIILKDFSENNFWFLPEEIFTLKEIRQANELKKSKAFLEIL